LDRKIKGEALESFYGKNQLVCSVSKNEGFEFLDAIGPDRRHEIMSLTLLMRSNRKVSKNKVKLKRKKHFIDYHCRLLQDCINLESLRLHYTGPAPFEDLKGVGNLKALRGIQEVSITFPRDRANKIEKSQDDAEPVFPGDPPCVEIRNDLEDELRAAWVMPRPDPAMA